MARFAGRPPSQIAGRIEANGQVVLTTPEGVFLYQGSQANAAGFIVSAAGSQLSSFMDGQSVFNQPAPPSAAVLNASSIILKQAGVVVLVAPQVANLGVIQGKFGQVVLAGAETATLGPSGDRPIAIDVTGELAGKTVGLTGPIDVSAPTGNPGTIILDPSATAIVR